jgi:tight adherence protein B
MIPAITILIFAAIFLAVFSAVTTIGSARNSPAAELKRRLRQMSAAGETNSSEGLTSELIQRETSYEKIFHQLPLMATVRRWVEHSGVHITPFRFVLFSTLAALSSFIVVAALSGNRLAGLLAMILFGAIPALFLKYRKHQRLTMFDEQFPDALTMVARSLRVGHSLPAAIELISQEIPEPTGGLFKIAYERQLLGMRITDALGTLLDRIESMDLSFFVTIIRINSESGGNLADILEKLAETIRSRLQIRRQVKVYTAEGRMSGYVLFLLPIFIFIAFYIMKPDYMVLFFTDKICQMALVCALLMQCAGFLMIRKIINIRI